MKIIFKSSTILKLARILEKDAQEKFMRTGRDFDAERWHKRRDLRTWVEQQQGRSQHQGEKER